MVEEKLMLEPTEAGKFFIFFENTPVNFETELEYGSVSCASSLYPLKVPYDILFIDKE